MIFGHFIRRNIPAWYGSSDNAIKVGDRKIPLQVLERTKLIEETDPSRKVFLVGFMKSGNTWMGTQLSRYKQRLLEIDEFHYYLYRIYAESPAYTPQILIYHGGSNYPASRKQFRRWRLRRLLTGSVDSARYFNLDRCGRSRIVFLVRDPRDVVVSYYHHRSAHFKHNKFKGSISEFVRNPNFGILSVIKFMNYIADRRRQFEHTFRYYEEMHKQPERELSRLLEFMGLRVVPEYVDDAVEFASFSAMKQMEYAAIHPQLGQRNVNDSDSFRVRKGRVGGYREELTEGDVAWLNETLASRLDPFYTRYIEPA